MSLNVFWVELDAFPVRLNGLVRSFLSGQAGGEVEVGQGGFRVELEAFLVAGDGVAERSAGIDPSI